MRAYRSHSLLFDWKKNKKKKKKEKNIKIQAIGKANNGFGPIP